MEQEFQQYKGMAPAKKSVGVAGAVRRGDGAKRDAHSGHYWCRSVSYHIG